ncbi:MAG: PA14 domain-containing protein, partial [Planctomycetota bacterium]
NDPHPRVRLEAVVGASFFDSAEAASVALEALRHPTDRFLDYALQETMKALAPRWKEALRNGRSIAAGNPPGIRYLLGRVGPEELVELPRVPEVLETMLSRPGMDRATRLDAARELARQKRTTLGEEILNAVRSLDRSGDPTHVLNELGPLLQEAVSGPEPPSREALATLARGGRSLAVRELGYASLVALDRSADRAWRACSKSRGALRAFLGGVSRIASPELRASLYPKIRPCMFALPAKLREAGVASGPSGLSVAYHRPAPADALLAALREREPEARLRASMFTLDLPGVSRAGSFGLLFRGRLLVPEKGKYRFFSESDDGSRIYIRGRCVVNNDGPHGMRERSAWVELDAGSHPISVTYVDQGGADGLEISWQGPGFDKEPIPAEVLTGDDAGSIRAAAISAMAHVPGNESQKFADAGRLLGEEGLLEPAIALLRSIPKARWPRPGIRPVIETIAARVSGLPAEQRTEPDVVLALEAGHELARELSAEEAGSFGKQLEGLGGSIILIRTVPHRMLYDVTEFWVKTGEPVAIVLQNNDMMPHNLVITRAGAMARVGRAAEHLSGRGGQRDFIPRSNDVLWHTALLYPGQTERLAFVAPEASGDRPFVCTFPGHWRVMNGVMHVVDELEQGMRVARRSSEGGSAPPREFVKQWTLADLQAALAPGWEAGRSLPRGQRLFAEAGCKKCHSFNGAGLKSGPDLSEIGKKYAARDLLRQILEPSAEILEGFVYHEIQLERGGDVFGRVVKDDGESLHVVQTLQNPDDVTVIPKSAIESMEKSDLSAMPTGLLVTLTREEILDLLAWLRAGRFSDNK